MSFPSKYWWALTGLLQLAISTFIARDSWVGWRWPADVTPAASGAEIEAAVFLVGALVCFGVSTVLHELDKRFGRRSS